MSNLGQSIQDYPDRVITTMKSIPISSHSHSGILNGCSNPAGLCCSALTLWHVSHNYMYSAISRFMSCYQYLVSRSWYILVLPGWIEYAESWASQRISSQIGLRLGTHIHFPNHKVPGSSLVKSLVLFSFMSCHISFSLSSSSWAFLISTLSIGSISTSIAASFTIARLRYPNSWHNSSLILMASVAL
jgi:hypothetical protein